MASCTQPLLLRLLASSVTAATRAGKIVRDVMSRGDLGIVDKGIDDLQTEADRSAQRCIIASLSQEFPNILIIGEEPANHNEVPSDWIVTDYDQTVMGRKCPEKYNSVGSDDIVVWVDPLDGTKEFTQGLVDHVTVLVGLAVKGQAVGGVIHQPFYNQNSGRTLWGMLGVGVGGFTPQQPPHGKLIVTTTRSHSRPSNVQAVAAVQPDEIIRAGGAGHKVILLLEGKAHLFVFASPGTKKWDTCAPEAVLAAAGGILTDCTGNPYKYDKDIEYNNDRGIFASGAGVDHSELLAKLPANIRSGDLKSIH